MPKLVILGSSNAIPDAERENTHMALLGEQRTVLIDCVGTPLVRLQQAGIDYRRLTDLILTHFHPDHVGGAPNLLMNLWLLGRKDPLHVYGLRHTLERLEKVMELFDWGSWPNFFPLRFHALAEEALVPVLSCDDFRIQASPVKHLVPTIGLRVDFPASGKALAYSCDTEPYHNVVELASGVDVLIHEASGASVGHSSAEQAASIARQAEAGRLYLIHYPAQTGDPGDLVTEARRAFDGPVELARDFMQLEF